MTKKWKKNRIFGISFLYIEVIYKVKKCREIGVGGSSKEIVCDPDRDVGGRNEDCDMLVAYSDANENPAVSSGATGKKP